MKPLGCSSIAPPPGSASSENRRLAAGAAMQARIRAWLVARIRARSDWLFRGLDERARQHGWTMETGPYGLSRSYRDPRFDTLRTRPGIPPAGAGDAPERGLLPAGRQASVNHD
jgi:hypothetical protein